MENKRRWQLRAGVWVASGQGVAGRDRGEMAVAVRKSFLWRRKRKKRKKRRS